MRHLNFLSSSGSDFKPDRDWRTLFGSFLVLATIIFSVSIYIYRELNTLEARGRARAVADSDIRLDRSALERAVGILSGKKERLETLLATPPSVVDPAR